MNRLRQTYDPTPEGLSLDDNSRDGNAEAVEASGSDRARIIVRTETRGLRRAVIDGFCAACRPVLNCTDCDLSRPPKRSPQMAPGLEAGQPMVIGSPYAAFAPAFEGSDRHRSTLLPGHQGPEPALRWY